MTLSLFAIGEAAIAETVESKTTVKATPRNRTATARGDRVLVPEAR